MNINTKQISFNLAMKKYHEKKRYGYIYFLVSFFNVTMQFYLLSVLFTLNFEWYSFLVIFLLAYFLTDFINGYVHLYMDNNHNYEGIIGPFVASFHLHHRHPTYRDFSVVRIYFNESGTKFWLVVFLFLTILLSFMEINTYVLMTLILIGILSSMAEVSHFLCHNGQSRTVLFLQQRGVLLSMEHHKKHHEEDNQSYAFLNGMSNFFLDKIANKFYVGYEKHADLHAKAYKGEDTKNR